MVKIAESNIIKQKRRIDQINGILYVLNKDSEGHKGTAFRKLAHFNEISDIDYVFEQLLDYKEMKRISLLLHYLTLIDTPPALEKMLLLLNDDNEKVRREASFMTKKIMGRRRALMLISMLESKFNDVIQFAVQEINTLKTQIAIIPLTNLLSRIDDKDIQLDIIKGLGNYKDQRILYFLEHFIEEAEGKIQEAALSEIDKYSPYLGKEFLTRSLKSNIVPLRQIAYLSTLRLRSKYWEKKLSECFNSEADDNVKMRVLLSIRTITTKELFNSVWTVASDVRLSKIRMMAQSVFKRIKTPLICKWLLNELSVVFQNELSTNSLYLKLRKSKMNQIDFTILLEHKKEILMRLLSIYTSDKKVQSKLIKVFKYSKNNKIKSIILESLGQSKDTKVMDFLIKQVIENHASSYSAAIALVEMMNPNTWHIVKKILDLDEKEYSPVIQIFLSYMQNLPEGVIYPPDIISRIQTLCYVQDKIIRALSISCFAKTPGEDQFDNLLVLLAEESSDPFICNIILKEVLIVVSKDPSLVSKVVSVCLFVENLFPLVKKILTHISIKDQDHFRAIINNIFDLNEKNEIQLQREYPLDNSRLIPLIRNMIIKEKSLFIDILENSSWSDFQLKILFEVLNTTDLHKSYGLNIDFMANFFVYASTETKSEMLEFFKEIPEPSKVIEDIVFQYLTDAEDTQVKSKVEEVLAHWT